MNSDDQPPTDLPADDSRSEAERRRDAEVQAARVQPVQLHNAPVLLSDYDPEWPRIFDAYANRIHAALAPLPIALEHAGSTSVPGLAAKPVIDMVLTVPDATDEARYVPVLTAIGFTLHVREPDWFEHRLLKAPGFAGNLHVFTTGCDEVTRMLRFRDWLRSHDEDRQWYESTKRQLAARTWRHVQDYADAKSDVVTAINVRAQAASGN